MFSKLLTYLIIFLHRLPTERSIVAGWGRNFEEHKIGAGDFANSGAYTPKLQKADVPLLNGTKCKEDFPVFKSISSDRHICGGGESGKARI